ncbi:hypothetical protein V5740_11205 [Croceibacterium sp. TMG7-5b_MA50]|uniref:hypothetical protein n=1 Tax=Croceibacterium sp. TMG7-5b_MA50 TaxID=3121290 RepID=UPI0032213E49
MIQMVSRPASIRAFALLFIAQGLIAFAASLADLSATQAAYAQMTGMPVTRDGAIIAGSARLTIVLIPVALAWWRRARLVRWLVPAMVTLRIVLAGPDMPLVEWITLPMAMAAAACLFLPGARRWFSAVR